MRRKADPDLVSIVGDLGKGFRSFFKRDKKAKATSPNNTIELLGTNHGTGMSLGMVYANEKAKTNIYLNSPSFPVGSIIVRERHDDELKPLPNTVIAMVKRQVGFSPKTGDWEFFMFDGRSLALQLRETIGNCAACHVQAKASDWSFRTYITIPR